MNIKSNILIISAVFPPEPIVSAQLSLDIATELSKNNSVVVLSPKSTRPYNFKFEKNDLVYPFEHIITKSYTCPKSKLLGRMRESYSFGKHCVKYIEEHHKTIDRIYLNAWPLLSQYLIVKAAKRYNIITITHVQDIYPESITNKIPIGKNFFYHLLLPIDKYILRNSNKVLCISDNMMKQLTTTRRVSAEKFVVVNNWQNEEAFIEFERNELQSKDNNSPFTFMYLGNNGPVAGVEFLIKAFVKADIDNSQLIVAGSGSRTEACKELAANLNSTDKIKFVPVPEGKVPEIQSLADVMLLPVKTGGAMSSIPSKLPAYMFSSKPIIGSLDLDSDTARAIIKANAGIVIEPENELKLIYSMREVAKWTEADLLEKGRNGFLYALDNFSRKTNLKKVVEIIEK